MWIFFFFFFFSPHYTRFFLFVPFFSLNFLCLFKMNFWNKCPEPGGHGLLPGGLVGGLGNWGGNYWCGGWGGGGCGCVWGWVWVCVGGCAMLLFFIHNNYYSPGNSDLYLPLGTVLVQWRIVASREGLYDKVRVRVGGYKRVLHYWIISIFPYSLLTSIQSFTGVLFVSGQDTLTGMMTTNSSSSDASCPIDLCLTKFMAYELNQDVSVAVDNQTVPCGNGEDNV